MTQPPPDTPAQPSATSPSLPHPEAARGALYGLAAYLLWGFFPLYFHALGPSGPLEVLAHRILWSLLFCLVVLVVGRRWQWLRPLLARRKLLLGLTLAALVLALNWGVYVGAVMAGHTSEAALGYFLNPLLTVALGVVILGEPLRRLQWVAVGIGALAAAYLTVVGGRVPWIALTLAVSFALYGLIKKRVGASLPALHGLTDRDRSPAAGGRACCCGWCRTEPTWRAPAGSSSLARPSSGLVAGTQPSCSSPAQ
ncbi:MAG: EamA family transporter RarD [Dermatophilaceae bacterium]